MINQRALNQYQQVNHEALIEGATPYQLIQLLMKGCLQRIVEARAALKRRDIAARGEAITKAINIVAGLQSSLNKEVNSTLPEQLDGLYDYMQHRLVEANLNSSDAMLDEVSKLMLTLKEGWDGIGQQAAAK